MDAIKRAFPYYTGSTEDPTGVANYGGGVFFTDHELYFYTARRAIEVRTGFDGKAIPGGFEHTADVLVELLSAPRAYSRAAGLELYDMKYGCLELDLRGRAIDSIAMHGQRCAATRPFGSAVGDSTGKEEGLLPESDCNNPKNPNFNQPCGECGGRVQCDGQCSNNTPRCRPGFVVDPVTPGFCISRTPRTLRNDLFSVGGAQWDKCDPCGCGLGFDRKIDVPCGVGMVQHSLSIGKEAGGTGQCTGGWASNDPTNCSVNVRYATSWCDNIKCRVTVTAVARRPQCTP